MNPGLFEGAPSLAALAKGLGITRAALSAHAAKVSREFGLTNRGQVHGWNRKPVAPRLVPKTVRRQPLLTSGPRWIQLELRLSEAAAAMPNQNQQPRHAKPQSIASSATH